MTSEQRDALYALDAMGARGARIEVSTFPDRGTSWHPCGSPERLAWLVQHLEDEQNAEAWLSIPRNRGGNVRSAMAFWARVETPASLTSLRAFKPLPSLVLQEGSSSRHTALWWLQAEVPWEALVKGNKRIAYRLRSMQKWADPDGEFRIPAPGSVLREGRKRGVPVDVKRCVIDAFYPRDVVGRLKDPPPPNDQWRQG